MTGVPSLPGPPASGHQAGPAGGYAGQPATYGPTGGYAGQQAYVAGSPWGPLAGWGTRVAAALLDSLLGMVSLVPIAIGGLLLALGVPKDRTYNSVTGAYELTGSNGALITVGIVVMVLGYLLGLGIQLWNRVFRMGRTGQSIGKSVMGIRLVDERTGLPMRAGMCFVRELAHVLDGAVYIGYLWPLWDDKRQTFADMILGTVVVETPKT
jgi:uncharacterized RDD family membrane protein YckC